MTTIRPFQALRPAPALAAKIAALPYDVYSREEARLAAEANPLSFLCIDRPETQFPKEQDMYAPEVYTKAAQMLRDMEGSGRMVRDASPCFYIWELCMNGRSQTGLVACSAVDDYLSGIVKRHENTLSAQEQDRIRHIDVCCMQTGPIFLAYRSRKEITALIQKEKAARPLYVFTADDGVSHRAWRIDDPSVIRQMAEAFAALPCTYIADGHHRAASAVAVAQKRRDAHPGYTGNEEFNYFLSVLFPDDELEIMAYNRVLKGLAGRTPAQLLKELEKPFQIAPFDGDGCFTPAQKGEMGLYLDGRWYCLQTRKEYQKTDPVGTLDVEYLQREVLSPIWGIHDPRKDSHIDFVGGIRGPEELVRRCHDDCAAAFHMYPTHISELLAVADAGLLMPPKSTWFEPKLRSGLFLHPIEKNQD